MASLRDIRQKIGGVSTTQQITSAMKLMSTARLGRALETINLMQPYIAGLEQLFTDLAGELPELDHPAITPRPVNSSCILVIGGERGLCGAFNQDISRFVNEKINADPSPDKKIIAVGRKMIRHFELQELETYEQYPDLIGKTLSTDLPDLSNKLYKLYNQEKIDEIKIIYTNYAATSSARLTCQRVLPIDVTAFSSQPATKNQQTFDFYPSPYEILKQLIPRHLRLQLFRAITESVAAEQTARMIAMTSATDRAQEIIDELKLDLNRSRQAQITGEIAEVIAGSQF